MTLVQDFARSTAGCPSMAELKALVEAAAFELSFDYFALVHHVRFGHPAAGAVRLTNYPLDWLAVVRERNRLVDPILRAAERASGGFRWDSLERVVSLTERERAVLKQAARHGIGPGFTIPNHVPGETFGSCHFAVGVGKTLPDQNTYAAHLIGSFAFDAARRLVEQVDGSEAHQEPAPLTDRQRECLVFAAKGKSDSVIGQLLNIKPATVNEHIEAAKRRYCVATRTQLIVRALFRSEILYSELLS
jgi:LuxR family quorum-sensing system transcriptional regulator CciR